MTRNLYISSFKIRRVRILRWIRMVRIFSLLRKHPITAQYITKDEIKYHTALVSPGVYKLITRIV